MKINKNLSCILDKLKDDVLPDQVKTSKNLLNLLFTRIPNLSDPVMVLTDEDTLQIAWDNRRYYIDIDIYLDGTIQWSYKDRENGPKDEAITNIEELPEKFIEYLVIVNDYKQ